jgi:hypothetical protein
VGFSEINSREQDHAVSDLADFIVQGRCNESQSKKFYRRGKHGGSR